MIMWLLTIVLVIAFIFMVVACILFFLLEQYGVRTTGVVLQKEAEQQLYRSRSAIIQILKAVIHRHKMQYRFDDANGKRHFGNQRINDDIYYRIKPEDMVEIAYLKAYPDLNIPVELLSLRMTEMLKIGGILVAFWFLRALMGPFFAPL